MDRMIRADHIDPRVLDEDAFDDPLGVATGAAHIFGVTGGVMDAALRSAYFLLTGSNPDPDAFTAVRGLDGWKEATFDMGGTPLRVAVASGLQNTHALLEALKAGEVAYDFIEIMACPGGCAGGGGQPIHDGCEMADLRGSILWTMDKNMELRFSHENPSIKLVYDEFFGEPLSHVAHELLHTDHFGWDMPLAPGVRA
jgi:NADH-quinone oxidoreductase subunit G